MLICMRLVGDDREGERRRGGGRETLQGWEITHNKVRDTDTRARAQRAHAHKHKHAHAHKHTHAHAHAHIKSHTQSHTHAHTHDHAHTHLYLRRNDAQGDDRAAVMSPDSYICMHVSQMHT